MYINKDDIASNIYTEIIDEITRGNDDDVDKKIKSAIDTTKAYLSRYDLVKLFGTEDLDPEIDSEMLKTIVVDIASWYLVRKANPNIDLSLFKTAYDEAIAALKDIQKGASNPDGWPVKQDDPDTALNEGSGSVQWNSNRKRQQHF